MSLHSWNFLHFRAIYLQFYKRHQLIWVRTDGNGSNASVCPEIEREIANFQGKMRKGTYRLRQEPNRDRKYISCTLSSPHQRWRPKISKWMLLLKFEFENQNTHVNARIQFVHWDTTSVEKQLPKSKKLIWTQEWIFWILVYSVKNLLSLPKIPLKF